MERLRTRLRWAKLYSLIFLCAIAPAVKAEETCSSALIERLVETCDLALVDYSLTVKADCDVKFLPPEKAMALDFRQRLSGYAEDNLQQYGFLSNAGKPYHVRFADLYRIEGNTTPVYLAASVSGSIFCFRGDLVQDRKGIGELAHLMFEGEDILCTTFDYKIVEIDGVLHILIALAPSQREVEARGGKIPLDKYNMEAATLGFLAVNAYELYDVAIRLDDLKVPSWTAENNFPEIATELQYCVIDNPAPLP